jgi:hypothetical protein
MLALHLDAVMPDGRYVEATAAVLVTLPGGEGRLMGEAPVTHVPAGQSVFNLFVTKSITFRV